MKLTDNNALNVLIVVNVIALLAIFTLLWVLWKDGLPVAEEKVGADKVGSNINQSIDESVVATPVADTQQASVEEAPKKNLSMSEKIRLEVGSTDELLDNEINKKQTASGSPASSSSASRSVTEVKDLSELSDIEYVVQYQKTKDEVQPERNISNEDVTRVKVVKNADESKLNKFNNIDVSGLKNRTEMLNSITTRISSLMAAEQSPDETETVEPKAWDDYLDSLKSAEVERKNEMRTIRVKKGESLWQIAYRAYGNGFLYKKIFKANPQLTNPNRIVVGQKLRVPL